MTSGLKVYFTKKADKDFEDILTYIKRDFGETASKDFKQLIFRFADLIKNFPEIGSLEVKDKGIRGFVLHGRLKVFYRVKIDRVIVLRLFDTRQLPAK